MDDYLIVLGSSNHVLIWGPVNCRLQERTRSVECPIVATLSIAVPRRGETFDWSRERGGNTQFIWGFKLDKSRATTDENSSIL